MFFLSFQIIMASYESIINATAKGQLLQARGLVQALMMSSAKPDDQVEALLGQVRLAKVKTGQRGWLSIVADEANSLQFHDPGWISKNVATLHQPVKKPSAMPAGPVKDVRRLEDPTLPVVSADEGRAARELQELDLITTTVAEMLDSPEFGGMQSPMEVEPVPTTSGAPSPARRTSPRKTVLSPVNKPTGDPTPSTSGVRPSPRRTSPRKAARSPVKGKPATDTRPARCPVRAPARSPRKSSASPRKMTVKSRERSPRRARPEQSRGHTGTGSRKGPLSQDRRSDSRKESGRRGDRRDTTSRRDQPRGRSPGSRRDDQDARKRHRVESRGQEAKRHRPEPEGSRARVDTSACPVPGCREQVSRSHAFEVHLPAFLDERRSLSHEVTRSRANLLIACSTRLVGCLDVQRLATFIGNLKMVTRGCVQSSKQMRAAVTALGEEIGHPVPDDLQVVPNLPPALLMHWRVFLVVLGCLDSTTRQELREQFPAISVPFQQRQKAVDSHFHLDRVRNKLGRKRLSFTDMLEVEEPDAGDEVWVTGGVAVFCDPQSYPSQEEVDSLVGLGVGVAIGLHPNPSRPYKDEDWSKFRRCLQFSGVCALGEVGLDHVKGPVSTWDSQHEVLDQALDYLTPERVLVIHSRDNKTEMLELLFHLKGRVPADQRIHLHCFSGKASTRDKWIQAFPNVHFGFTPLVASFNNEQKEALRTLEVDRLLIETDAPYFSGEGRSISTPAFVGTSARCVCTIRSETWEELLRVTAVNARRLYRLQ